MPTALEAGTLNGHGIAGLGAAVSYLEETGLDVIREKEQSLMRRFYAGVSRIPGIKVYGDFSTWKRAAIVSFNIGDYDSSEVSDELNMEYGIVTRPGAHCAPLHAPGAGNRGTGSRQVQLFPLQYRRRGRCRHPGGGRTGTGVILCIRKENRHRSDPVHRKENGMGMRDCAVDKQEGKET